MPDPEVMGRSISGRMLTEWQAFLKIKKEDEDEAMQSTHGRR